MVKKNTKADKTTRRVYKPGAKKINKAEKLRGMLSKKPNLSFAAAKEQFGKMNLTLASAQFYSIRRKVQAGTSVRSGKKVKPAKPPAVVAAKASCLMEPKTASELYGDPSLSLEANTQPPNVERTLTARRLLQKAISEAWEYLGRNNELVDLIIDDIQGSRQLR